MKIAVLTSSRADYGIFLPLLLRLKSDGYFELELIVFGTHLSKSHGHTLNQIISDGFDVPYRLNTVPKGDSPKDIAASIGDTIRKFSGFWNENKDRFDLIFLTP